MVPRVVVAAAVVERGDEVLVTRRLRGTHLEGLWEFPGGKCEPGETLAACLEREMREELGVAVTVGSCLLETTHAYPSKTVELHFFACRLLGDPVPQLGQEMRWLARTHLDATEFPAADRALIAQLRAR
jgi:mutator protein MutT